MNVCRDGCKSNIVWVFSLQAAVKSSFFAYNFLCIYRDSKADSFMTKPTKICRIFWILLQYKNLRESEGSFALL